ncbi:multicomponent Na+:H+ antiporter subunit E [Sedimentibacter acidaminivorans]|uniref:Multicomponent Na+:H+ antiporter subunit E n=1 Tax=Sedimentibacter acidaminivorans TaxID=913099 RepID=A0ABS4GED1_9FIRM|nr:Na+/H+ antiporter subunit E [Sedimentibacter acidaminivorans]MBP1925997.1 multicomponent Na+:H+ antiporter subunit E [Sedimentibacter acidaminivorans]
MNYKMFGLYVLFWLILSQNFNFERIVVGTVVCAIIFVFNKELLNNQRKNSSIFISISNVKYYLLYFVVLIKEIFKSNFHVAKIVLSPKLNISPSIVIINTKLKSELNKTILANSITLTPGTLTLDMYDDKLIVHCLDKEAANGLENNSFEGILLKKEEISND